jgi:hypothetical protein
MGSTSLPAEFRLDAAGKQHATAGQAPLSAEPSGRCHPSLTRETTYEPTFAHDGYFCCYEATNAAWNATRAPPMLPNNVRQIHHSNQPITVARGPYGATARRD